MKNKSINPFTALLPSIDLHGEDRVNARIMTEEFIKDNIKLRNKKILIIHGKGSGIVKNEVYKLLKNNKNIKSYELDMFNDGATIDELIISLILLDVFLTSSSSFLNIFLYFSSKLLSSFLNLCEYSPIIGGERYIALSLALSIASNL